MPKFKVFVSGIRNQEEIRSVYHFFLNFVGGKVRICSPYKNKNRKVNNLKKPYCIMILDNQLDFDRIMEKEFYHIENLEEIRVTRYHKKENKRVYLSGIPEDWTTEELGNFANKIGPTTSCNFIENSRTTNKNLLACLNPLKVRSNRIGVIWFKYLQSAEEALKSQKNNKMQFFARIQKTQKSKGIGENAASSLQLLSPSRQIKNLNGKHHCNSLGHISGDHSSEVLSKEFKNSISSSDREENIQKVNTIKSSKEVKKNRKEKSDYSQNYQEGNQVENSFVQPQFISSTHPAKLSLNISGRYRHQTGERPVRMNTRINREQQEEHLFTNRRGNFRGNGRTGLFEYCRTYHLRKTNLICRVSRYLKHSKKNLRLNQQRAPHNMLDHEDHRDLLL